MGAARDRRLGVAPGAVAGALAGRAADRQEPAARRSPAGKLRARTVTVGKVDFKAWASSSPSTTCASPRPRPARRRSSSASLYADAELQSVLRLAPVIDAVNIRRSDRPARPPGRRQIRHRRHLARFAPYDDPPPGEPQRFAVYNIAITGGSVDFDGQPVKRKHELRDFELKVPFVSNLASKREVKSSPSWPSCSTARTSTRPPSARPSPTTARPTRSCASP